MVAQVIDTDAVDYEYVTEVVDIGSLRPHPRNYQGHPKDQLDHIKASIEQHGLYRNVVISSDGYILAGHGVTQALRELGRKRVVVKRLPYAYDSPEAVKVLTADNEISHLAERDDRLLTELLKEVKDLDPKGLLGTGYDEPMLANLVMVTRPANEIKDHNEAAEWVGMPEYDLEPDTIKIVVNFENEDDRQDFARTLGVSLTEKTRSMWWPPKDRQDTGSLLFGVNK